MFVILHLIMTYKTIHFLQYYSILVVYIFFLLLSYISQDFKIQY